MFETAPATIVPGSLMSVARGVAGHLRPPPTTCPHHHHAIEGFAQRRSPHQFRTRNDRSETQQTRSNASNLQEDQRQQFLPPPLITVWLEVRVLPGPPVSSIRGTAVTAPAPGRCRP